MSGKVVAKTEDRLLHVLSDFVASLTFDEIPSTVTVEFPRFDGHNPIMKGECRHAENEEPVPCGIQGADGCARPHRAKR